MLHIGAVIKQLRVQKGISLVDFSKDVSISHGRISEYEAGKAEPRPERLKKIAAYFGVDHNEMLGMVADGKKKSDKILSEELDFSITKAFFLSQIAQLKAMALNISYQVALDELSQSFAEFGRQHMQQLKG